MKKAIGTIYTQLILIDKFPQDMQPGLCTDHSESQPDLTPTWSSGVKHHLVTGLWGTHHGLGLDAIPSVTIGRQDVERGQYNLRFPKK